MVKIKNFINKHFFTRKVKFEKNIKFKGLNVEKEFNHLPFTSGIGFPQWHYFSVIQMNSTFLEMTDKEHYQKGFWNFLLVCFALFGGSLLLQALYMFIRSLTEGGYFGLGDFLFIFCCLFPACFILPLWGFYSDDNRGFSHHPIRFNRQTQKVYFMDFDGQYHVYDWKDLKFYIPEPDHAFGYHLEVCVVDEKGVIEQRATIGPQLHGKEHPEMMFHFIITYMCNGPEPLYPYYTEGMEYDEEKMLQVVTFCNDIYNKRETPEFSRYRINIRNFGSAVFNALSFISGRTFVLMLGRQYAMKRLKVPMWPEWIEQENIILENDPYRVDAEINKYFQFKPSIRRIKVHHPLPEKLLKRPAVEKPKVNHTVKNKHKKK